MSSKNISISEKAYMRLRRARRNPRESFSEVIQRGHWENGNPTAQNWLESFADVPLLEDTILQELEDNQLTDTPPVDKWL